MFMVHDQELLEHMVLCLGYFYPKINNHPLTIVGNGNQTRDFIFISDIIDGLIKAAKGKHKNKIYNLGSGKETSIKYIANLISKNKFTFRLDLESHYALKQTFKNLKRILTGNQNLQ